MENSLPVETDLCIIRVIITEPRKGVKTDFTEAQLHQKKGIAHVMVESKFLRRVADCRGPCEAY